MITPVSKDNVQAWAALCVALWPCEEASDNSIADWINEWEHGELPHEFIYYVNGEPAAFISLGLRHDYVEGTDSSPVGYLEGIYVAPNFRKRGIAREMVEFAKDWAREKGCIEFASDCELENEESRLFHVQAGFEEVGRVVCFRVGL